MSTNEEKINHPQHYGGDTTYEAIKVIEAWDLGFCLGNTVKYIARAEHKVSEIEDLKKAAWYLTREISRRVHQEVQERVTDYARCQACKIDPDPRGPSACSGCRSLSVCLHVRGNGQVCGLPANHPGPHIQP